MTYKIARSLALLAVALTATAGLFAQSSSAPRPAASPASTLHQRVGLTDIEINYSRPSVKDRSIFAREGLVPFGEVWRTGANAATTVTFGAPVKLAGKDVPAGTYALFTIPSETEWTVILQKASKGVSATYDEAKDFLRVNAKPVKLSESVETFTIDLNDLRDTSATLNLIWEKTRVPVKLEVTLPEAR